MRKFLITNLILVSGIGLTACATKNFVRISVGEVDDRVGSLSKEVEETQERTRQNERRLGEVDQKAQAAQQLATQADTAARRAGPTAAEASTIAKAVDAKADAMDKASKRLLYEVVLSESEGNFMFGKSDLPEAAKEGLDRLIGQLRHDPKNVFIEIEGHTDNSGSKIITQKIGLERAEAVRRYLYERYHVPLHKMNVVSYGEEKPTAPNNTKAGRAQNRRVVIKVLA
jgi:peptidoglycan-associated lipoprotein